MTVLDKRLPNGITKTRMYNIWTNVRYRCNNSNCKMYSRYGGRGITICKEWDKFFSFYTWSINNGYADNLTIDRIDVNGNYEPSNCRWLSNFDQQSNKRTNVYVNYRNKRYTIAQLSRKVGLPDSMLRHRIDRGWDIEIAVSTPRLFNWKKEGIK